MSQKYFNETLKYFKYLNLKYFVFAKDLKRLQILFVKILLIKKKRRFRLKKIFISSVEEI